MYYHILIDITPIYPEARELVEQHRREQAELLFRSLCTMRKTTSARSPQSSDDIVRMIWLESDRLPVGAEVYIIHYVIIIISFTDMDARRCCSTEDCRTNVNDMHRMD